MNTLKWLSPALCIFFISSAFTMKQTSDLKSIFEREWIALSYGDPAINIETPAILKLISIDVPEQVKQYIDKMSTYQFEHEALLIMTNTLQYKGDVAANLQGAANGSVTEMKKRDGIEDFTYIEKSITVSGQAAIIQSGSFRSGNDRLDFHNIITVKGNKMWQVFIAYNSGDEYGPKLKDKVVASIKI
jgi:hypothetical protein